MSKKNRRAQTPKPNRHSADARTRRVLDLRNGSRTSRHVVRREDDKFRKYGVNAYLKD